ncbi:tRNA(m5U54)methyltransferase [Aspergillus heteromorphus CBS 117.55]|uniref:tRNA(M5U54)methyltransferase n=1 Tax=Aspergillus heteromorphus CBS 117.55 TaxID=1448321 RepID=A0A317WF45_9EURO|nr:tRNA(m5U54)methyltransferase [Aspergillus heteromorphus CBS 117.55]PWY84899.1 tRNA(m5U54)methyltransferase [Aspergillus heteromorphus CBS 117.55]
MMQFDSPRKPDLAAKRRKKVKAPRDNKSSGFDEVLQADIDALLRRHKPDTEVQTEPETDDAATPPQPTLPETFTELEVQVADISSTGDGLALSENQKHVYVVPFTVPGDKALVKIVRHFPDLSYSLTDFVKVLEPGSTRNDAGIGCQYFGKCSGCQLQMMSYEDQLAHKKRIVEKAYANFSGLIPELIPAIGDTFPSPMQYGYRTKLTPHFAAPAGAKRRGPREPHKEVPPIGFTYKNRRMDLDIEDCPLGTEIVRKGLKSERQRVADNLARYTKGATLLMRESTTRTPKPQDGSTPQSPAASTNPTRNTYIEEKRCVTDNNATSIEYVDDYLFSNRAGAFFQNNNSILPGFTEFIRQHALPPTNASDPKPIKFLLDAYSGSGLFTITLSPLFRSSLGVDVAADSIMSARENARDNNLPNTGFAAADAATLFKDGCSDDFLQQLLSYGPRRVVYVSCNVHTQARDVAVMVQGDEKKNIRYEIESIRGFDFFPQTGHVEGVAILNKATFPEKAA